jgi:hypothetical protein
MNRSTLLLSLALLCGCQSAPEPAVEIKAAGIIIYCEQDGETLLLLADHNWNDRGWASFGGACRGKAVRETAISETHEETAGGYSQAVIEHALGGNPEYVIDSTGRFASYVIKVDKVSAESMTRRSASETRKDYNMRGPYAWVPLSVILKAAEDKDGKIPQRYLPAKYRSGHLYTNFIDVLNKAVEKGLLVVQP